MMDTPSYYSVGQGDALAVMRGCMSRHEYVGFLRGNVIKYAVRLGRKGDATEDAKKMMDYATALYDCINGGCCDMIYSMGEKG